MLSYKPVMGLNCNGSKKRETETMRWFDLWQARTISALLYSCLESQEYNTGDDQTGLLLPR